MSWLSEHVVAVTIWIGALSTFAIYSVLYNENKFYRLFEHIFIGIASGYGVYITWSEVLGPKWWQPMVHEGQWYWAFAAVVGSMFYFIYSKKHMWISRVIFGLFMGLAAGGMFREFYEIYFPQMGASMKPLTAPGMSTGETLNVVVIYVILLTCMSYFFFSFEHNNLVMRKSAAMGRWFLMIGFGAIFGATVMGRMTLFIGRFNFLLNDWGPQVGVAWSSMWFRGIVIVAGAALVAWVALAVSRRRSAPPTPPESS
jgi:hypothetical protein